MGTFEPAAAVAVDKVRSAFLQGDPLLADHEPQGAERLALNLAVCGLGMTVAGESAAAVWARACHQPHARHGRRSFRPRDRQPWPAVRPGDDPVAARLPPPDRRCRHYRHRAKRPRRRGGLSSRRGRLQFNRSQRRGDSRVLARLSDQAGWLGRDAPGRTGVSEAPSATSAARSSGSADATRTRCSTTLWPRPRPGRTDCCTHPTSPARSRPTSTLTPGLCSLD